MKKSLTVLIIPDQAKKPYEFKLRHIFLWLMLTILGFCSVLLGFGLYGIVEAGRLKDETAVLKREVLIFRSQEQKINELEQMLLRLKKNNEKFTAHSALLAQTHHEFRVLWLKLQSKQKWCYSDQITAYGKVS